MAVDGSVHGSVLTNPVFSVGAVPLSVAAKDPSTVFADVCVASFRGRRWLIDRIDAFFAVRRCGFVWIEGDAGVGKTALAAHLASQRTYVAHFARLAGGTTTRVALRNLAAQLIEAFGLGAFAPGGMLPEWAHTPEGFEAVLTAAATAAAETGKALTLVLDGLDEAERDGRGMPWGIPALLPEGVFVIGTYRTGCPPGPTASDTVTLRLDVYDPRNRADIREYLQAAVKEEWLAAALVAAEVEGADFADTLARRCGGVWVYLRYVLDEVRIGLRSPDDIDALEAGLPHYYAAQMTRWEAQDSWAKAGAPLVGVLAALREPAEAEHLGRLAGVEDTALVLLWCDKWLRPYLTVHAGAERVYAIYHASAQEFFGGELPASDDGHPDHWLARAEVLRRGRRAAHGCIADAYLDMFGGLDEGLPRLVADPSLANWDGGFALRHLTHHLVRAERVVDLHKLLRADWCGTAGRWSNVWFAAHDHTDGLDEYLDDLARARRVAEAATDEELANGLPPCSWVLEARYALMRSCLGSLADSCPAELALELVKAGRWTPTRALDHARRLTDRSIRHRVLLDLRPHLPEEISTQVLQGVVTECDSLPDYTAAAATVNSLLSWRVSNIQPDEIDAARAAVDSLTGDERSQNLLQLIPVLAPEAQVAAALDMLEWARATENPEGAAWKLLELLPFLPEQARSSVGVQVLEIARVAPDNESRIRWMARLVPHINGDHRESVTDEVLRDAHLVPFDPTRVWVLSGLAENLSPHHLKELLKVTIDSVPRDYLGLVLPEVVPHLPDSLIGEVLAAARECSPGRPRINAFGAIVGALKDDSQSKVRGELHAMIEGLPANWGRASAWIDVMAEAPDGLLPALVRETLDLLSGTSDAGMRGHLAGLVTPYLDAQHVEEVLALVRSLPDDRHLAATLVSLAAKLPDECACGVIADALTILRQIPETDERVCGLQAILAQLPGTWLPVTLEAVLSDSEEHELSAMLSPLAPCLPHDLTSVALDAVLEVDDRGIRSEAVGVLLPHLDHDTAFRALSAVLAGADELPGPEWLLDWAPYIPPPLRPRVIALFVTMSDPVERSGCLLSLYADLPQTLRSRVVTEALDFASSASDHLDRFQMLLFVAPHLEDVDLDRTMDLARTIGDPWQRAVALMELAAGMVPEAAASVYDEALGIAEMWDHEAMGKFLCHMGADLPMSLLPRVLTWPESSVVWWLEVAGPQLPAAVVPEILDVVLGQRSDWWVAKGLIPLVPVLPQELLQIAMTGAPTEDGEAPAAIIRRANELCPDQSAADVIALLRPALDRTSREAVLCVMAAAAAPLARFGPAIAEACLAAVEDVRRWW